MYTFFTKTKYRETMNNGYMTCDMNCKSGISEAENNNFVHHAYIHIICTKYHNIN